MPQTTTANITLSSPYGPAAYTVTLTDRSEVTDVESAAARLPETVFRLTYGERWEQARAYFQDLAALLPFQAEAAVVLSDPPVEFKAIRKAFRHIDLIGDDDLPHRQRARLWLTHPAFLPALFRQKKLPGALATVHKDLLKTEDSAPYRALEPWLFALQPFVVDVAQRETLYHCLALMRTATTRNFLFGELERPGRHIYATGLLRSLRYFTTESDLVRLLELYPWINDDGLMGDYTFLLGQFSAPRIHDRLTGILDDFPHQAPAVLRALQRSEHPNPYAVIRDRFERETDGRLVDQLAELTSEAPTPTLRVSLVEMNTKMATPAFSEGPPVTWPQSLGTYWNQLVENATTEEVLAEVNKYLPRPEPRLQRNALLQLQSWAKRESISPALPLAIEDRLRELINARFDKIFTVALDIAAACMPTLSQPEAMVDVLLKHSLVSRYRLMNAAALKVAAERPGLRERQVAFFNRAITSAKDSTELEAIVRVIPYVNFLGVRQELEQLVAKRREFSGS